MTTVRIRDPGKMIGFPLMSPRSLPEAMSEPVKVTAPMTTSRTTKIVVESGAPAAPVSAAMLVAYLIMGLMGRVVPQIQLFAVGFPVTIALGLFMVAISLDLYVGFLNGMFDQMFKNVSDMIKGMS
jgi:flagellar biosynthetic protein FliR